MRTLFLVIKCFPFSGEHVTEGACIEDCCEGALARHEKDKPRIKSLGIGLLTRRLLVSLPSSGKAVSESQPLHMIKDVITHRERDFVYFVPCNSASSQSLRR